MARKLRVEDKGVGRRCVHEALDRRHFGCRLEDLLCEFDRARDYYIGVVAEGDVARRMYNSRATYCLLELRVSLGPKTSSNLALLRLRLQARLGLRRLQFERHFRHIFVKPPQ